MPEGLHFGFIVKASDPNETIPILSATLLPEGATFTDKGNGEGLFDWPTTAGQAGQYEITITASDGELIDLTDAILALRITGGIDPDTLVNKAADVDGDGRVGLAEAVYILKILGDADE